MMMKRKLYAILLLLIYTTSAFGLSVGQRPFCAHNTSTDSYCCGGDREAFAEVNEGCEESPDQVKESSCCEHSDEIPATSSCCAEHAVAPSDSSVKPTPSNTIPFILHTVVSEKSCCQHCGEMFVEWKYSETNKTELVVQTPNQADFVPPYFTLPKWMQSEVPAYDAMLPLSEASMHKTILPIAEDLHLAICVLRL